MGITSSQVIYSCEISPPNSKESGIFRNPLNKLSSELTFSTNPYILTLQDAFLNSVKKHPNKGFLGTRNLQGSYSYKTFKEVKYHAECIGSGLISKSLVQEISEYKDYKLKLMGIFSKNREEVYICEIACLLYGFTSVVIDELVTQDVLQGILQNTSISLMFCSLETLRIVASLQNTYKLANVVCFDQLNNSQVKEKKMLHNKSIELFTFLEIFTSGQYDVLPCEKITPESITTFLYTSGTTSSPKPAMISHKSFISVVSGLKQVFNFKYDDTHLSYLSLSHIFEKAIFAICLYESLTIGLYSGDIMKLKEDLQLFRPTIFASVPRLFIKFYESIKANIDQLTGIKRILLEKGIASKMSALKSNLTYTHTLYDKLVFNKIRGVFGGRVRLMATGGAPIPPSILDFLKVTTGCPIIQGYGLTESCGVSFATSPFDPNTNSVGGPLLNTEFKLLNVDEMGYTSITSPNENVNPKAQPQPQSQPQMTLKGSKGEILVRGPGVFDGYYKDPERTLEVLDEDGWLHTGDIGELQEDGSIRIVDRRKNIFKISQGGYIEPEKIERICLESGIFREIFVDGDGLESYLVGVGVPNQEKIEMIGEELNLEESYEKLCENEAVKERVLKELEMLSKARQLANFEIIRRIHLEIEGFAKKELYNNSFKLKRFKAREVFQNEIKKMYGKN